MKCADCGQEMRQGVACTDPDYDGIPRIPYGREPRKFGGDWPLTDPAPDEILGGPNNGGEAWTLHEDGCRDCGAPVGGLHHPGCDIEDCPVCGLQAIGCGCGNEDDE